MAAWTAEIGNIIMVQCKLRYILKTRAGKSIFECSRDDCTHGTGSREFATR